MPKLYEYFGLVVYFYANEHEPVHVHGEFQGRESKAELVVQDGRIVRIVFRTVRGRRPLTGAKLRDFKSLVQFKGDDIVRRWIDFHVMRRHNEPEVITRKLK
jgi:hypothetical protein